MIKRRLLFAGAFAILAWAVTSCEALKTCKVCKQVTYEKPGLNILEEGDAQEYCDADLIVIQNTPDVDLPNTITKWECN